MVGRLLKGFFAHLKTTKNLILKSVFLFLMLFAVVPSVSLNLAHATDEAGKADTSKETLPLTAKEQMISSINFLQVASSIAYVILRPLIALAGLAMDNQLIYGSFMHLDTSLWNIRQIVRNFANYALGLIFLVGILMYNLSPGGKIGGVLKGIDKPQGLIKKTLVAGVLIQASWFILMAMVDISTILTYSVGAIPTTLLATTDTAGQDTRMLGMNTLLNLGDDGVQSDKTVDKAIVSYRSVKKDQGSGKGLEDIKYIAPCKTVSVGKDTDQKKFIIGRAFSGVNVNDDSSGPEKKTKNLVMEPGYCIYMGSLVSFIEFQCEGDACAKEADFPQKMKTFADDITAKNQQKREELIKAGMIYPIGMNNLPVENHKPTGGKKVDGFGPQESPYAYRGGSLPTGCEFFGLIPSEPKVEKGKAPEYQCLYKETDLSLSNIISKGKSMTGPFVSLYSNVFNFSDITTYENLGVWQQFIMVLINTGFAILLVIPLIALAIVLFARVGILWIAIATAPFIVLLNVFKEVFPKDMLPDWLSPGELIQLLLAPVLVSLAVSLSLVVMTTLKLTLSAPATIGVLTQGMSEDEAKKVIKERGAYLEKISGMKTNEDGSLGILGFVKIHFDNGLINLSWVITMLFGLGITRFLLFWAIKQTKIGGSIGKGLQNFGQKALMSQPIIPIGQQGFSLQSIASAPKYMENAINTKLLGSRQEAVEALFDEEKRKALSEKEEAKAEKRREAEFSNNLSSYKSSNQSTYQETFKPDFEGNATQSINHLESVSSSVTKGEFSTLSQADVKKKVEEIETITKNAFEQLNKQGTSLADDPEDSSTSAYKTKVNIEKLLNIAVADKQSWLSDTIKQKTIPIGTKTYRIETQDNKIQLTLEKPSNSTS